jgi:hypothetical protein
MHDTVIYLGPTLAQSEASSILEATYLPPVCRGDLTKLPEETRIVGIIDGEFYQKLAVSPKEILPLLERGVQVFGASSMGALRAAEIHRYGMIGVGEVFRMFRDGILDGDDEVALVYDRNSYRHFSVPLVNLRRALELALEEHVIDQEQMESLVRQMKRLYFPDRSYRTLQALCPQLADFFRRIALPDVKRDDARQLLVAIETARGRECIAADASVIGNP